jgi:hypothetical protein
MAAAEKTNEAGGLGITRSIMWSRQRKDERDLADLWIWGLLTFPLRLTGGWRGRMKPKAGAGQRGNQKSKVLESTIVGEGMNRQEEERGTRDGEHVAKFPKNLDIRLQIAEMVMESVIGQHTMINATYVLGMILDHLLQAD